MNDQTIRSIDNNFTVNSSKNLTKILTSQSESGEPVQFYFVNSAESVPNAVR